MDRVHTHNQTHKELIQDSHIGVLERLLSSNTTATITQCRGKELMSHRDRYQEIWTKRATIYELAMKVLSDNLTHEQVLELQTTMDGDPNDGLFKLLTAETSKLFPERFVQEDEV
jgi:hypothetical protein